MYVRIFHLARAVWCFALWACTIQRQLQLHDAAYKRPAIIMQLWRVESGKGSIPAQTLTLRTKKARHKTTQNNAGLGTPGEGYLILTEPPR